MSSHRSGGSTSQPRTSSSGSGPSSNPSTAGVNTTATLSNGAGSSTTATPSSAAVANIVHTLHGAVVFTDTCVFECVVHGGSSSVGHRVGAMLRFLTRSPPRPDLALRACALLCGLPVAPLSPGADSELFERVSRCVVAAALPPMPVAGVDSAGSGIGPLDHGDRVVIHSSESESADRCGVQMRGMIEGRALRR